VKAILVAALLLCAAVPAARADEPEWRARAREHFASGKKHLEAGEYDDAVRDYQAAYELVPVPEMLFNLGQAYRLKGDKAKAVEHYQKYIAAEPRGRAVAEARTHIEVLGREVAAQAAEDARRAEEARAEEARRAAEDARQAEDAQRAEEARRVPAAAVPAPEVQDRSSPGRVLRISGLVTAGAGAVLVGAGAYFGVRAADLQSQGEALIESGRWDPTVDDIIARGRTSERLMLACTITGAAAVVGGGVMYFVGWRAAGRGNVSVAPTVGGAAVSFEGSF